MKPSRIVSAAALIVLIGAAPGVALSQMMSKQTQAAIQAQTTPSLPDVQARLTEVGRRLREAKLASFSRPLPEGDYVEAQREVARGEYREAMNHLNAAEQQLDGLPNRIGR
jgi:Flp pilus assembly protein CpaB